MKRNFVIFCIGWLAVLALASRAEAQETKLKWFGHAAFSITTPNGKVLLRQNRCTELEAMLNFNSE